MRCPYCGVDTTFHGSICSNCGYDRVNQKPAKVISFKELWNMSNVPSQSHLRSVTPEMQKDLISAFLESRSQPVRRLELKSKWEGNVERKVREKTDSRYNTEKADIAAAKREGVQYQSDLGKMLYTDIPGMSTFLKGMAAATFLPIAVFMKKMVDEREVEY